MSDRAGRPSGSKSLKPSQGLYSSGPSNSRPFLNMLNPMGRSHHGYIQANQSVLEEEEDEEGKEGDDSDGSQPDLEVGRSRSTLFQSTAGLAKSKGLGDECPAFK
jgi:autophagy-related protein 9